jgi:hypothetical protein
VIRLNVARLVEEHEYVTGRDLQTPYEREWLAVEDRYADEDDADAEAAELAALTTTWRARYAAYAQALTAAVVAEAARIPGPAGPGHRRGRQRPGCPDEPGSGPPGLRRLHPAGPRPPRVATARRGIARRARHRRPGATTSPVWAGA